MPITTTPRPEALQPLGADIQQRDLQRQMLEALRAAEDTLLSTFGRLANVHPTMLKIRAAVAAAEGVRS